MPAPTFIHIGTTPPSSGETGGNLLWFDSSINRLMFYNGAAWEGLAPEAAMTGGGTPSSTVTALDGSEAAGSSNEFSRGDHKHSDTARHTHSNKATLDNITAAYTTAEATKLAGIATGAEVNVNPDWNAGSGDAQILNKPATFAPSAHTHPQSEVTDLVTTLSGKSDTSHNHTITALNGFPGGTTNFLRADGSFAAPSGGSDPWTYVQVNGGSDFTTTNNVAQDVTGLAFTPAANTTYEFEAILLVRTATATVNPRIGFAWATGLTDGIAYIEQSQAATGTGLFASGNINAALLTPVGGLPNTTQSWPVVVKGTVRAGASPSGNCRIQLASETNGTTVRIVARSFLSFRTLPF